MALNNNAIFAIIAVAIVVVGGGAAVMLMKSPADNGGESETGVATSTEGYSRLAILGNANMDDVLDNKDVEFLEKVIKGEADANKYCNLNGDKVIDDKDVKILKDIIAGNATSLGYINVTGEECSLSVPVNNIGIGFRRTSEMVGFLAGGDAISVMTEGTKAQFSYVGFTAEAKANIINPGANNDSNVNSDVVMNIYRNFMNNGGLTIFGDSNGMDKNMESIAGDHIDVVRLPCTEGDRIAEGMITLAYMLAYKNDDAAAINERLNYWITLNDSTIKTISDEVAKIPVENRTKGIIALNNLTTSGGTTPYNIRGEGLSEYEFTIACGCNNITKQFIEGAWTSFDNDALMGLQQNGLTNIVIEIQTLFQKIDKAYNEANTAEEKAAALNLIDQLAAHASESDILTGYSGTIKYVGQETCNGPQSIFLRMYLASIYVPALKDTYSIDNINAAFQEYMGMLNPDSYLANAKIFA